MKAKLSVICHGIVQVLEITLLGGSHPSCWKGLFGNSRLKAFRKLTLLNFDSLHHKSFLNLLQYVHML